MNLTPREKDKLLIFTAALLAEKRSGRVFDRRASGRRSRREDRRGVDALWDDSAEIRAGHGRHS